jgi:hypothetical protein
LRTVKSLEVLSVNDRNSGISSNTITHESQHAMQGNRTAAKVARRTNIIKSLNSELNTCTPMIQCAQGIFADGSGGQLQQAAVVRQNCGPHLSLWPGTPEPAAVFLPLQGQDCKVVARAVLRVSITNCPYRIFCAAHGGCHSPNQTLSLANCCFATLCLAKNVVHLQNE